MTTALSAGGKIGSGRGPGSLVAFAWGSLGITLVTIVMGAIVRATHSGDGCGRSWPACDGSLVFPGTDDTARLIEFSHRMVSGVNLIVVAVLLFLIFRAFASGHPARRAGVWAMVFLVIEALIGAVIVLYGWVAEDRSAARQVSVPLHLVNTFLLTAALAYTVWVVAGGRVPALKVNRRLTFTLGGLAVLMMLTFATGATTSLADTLFRAESLAEGFMADFSQESAVILRLRVLHPVVAIGGGLLLAWFASTRLDETERRGRPWPARLLIFGVLIQATLGLVHIALLTPLVTGLLHLAIAQVLWVAFVLFALTLLEPDTEAAAI
ncbi:MAG: COX15/CtaA family protein [Chloroflexi bacterium]|nr:COX15/CtaA family protein [Chloroflexota bacterium]MDA1239813.1 COX15/CtaA family protein [Chloroflexota bacterium]